MTHEGGHMLGLQHLKDRYGEVMTSGGNPMSYVNPWSVLFLPGSWGDQRDGNFNPKQIGTIIEHINDKTLNRFGDYEKKQRALLPSRAPAPSVIRTNWATSH